MKAFRYIAKSGPSDRIEGVMQGESSGGIARALVARGLFPIHVIEIRSDGERSGLWGQLPGLARRTLRHRLDSQHLALLTRRLGDLLDAGVPMQKAMEQLHLQTQDRGLKRVLGVLANRIKSGESLSQAMGTQGSLFPGSLIGAIEAGETGGSLVPILLGLADLYEKEDDLRRTVRAALVYPLLVLAVSLATLLIMVLYLLPRLSVLYQDMGQQLPGPTRFLIALSALFQAHGMIILGILAVLIAATMLLHRKSTRFRRLLAAVLLAMPFTGRIILNREIVRFAHTLASLVGGGVPLVRGLWFAARGSGNAVIGQQLQGFGRMVGEGASLSEVIGESHLGDQVLVMMVQVGEEMGQLAQALEKACRIYERELREKMKVITTVLEPMLIVAIGLIVGFIVFSMMLPIMELDLA